MIGIELFSGAGGLSLGAHSAGINVSHAVEISKAAAKTFELNNPSTTVINNDIRLIDPTELLVKTHPFVVFGGPPCQGFSTSNQRNRNRQNGNNWLFEEFLRFVQALKPELVVFENVAGITHTDGGFFRAELETRLSSLGYHVTTVVADASRCGVPQRRNRFFCAASKSKKLSFENLYDTDRPVTVEEAISDLPDLVVGNNDSELTYKQDARSEYATRMRGRLSACSGHLVTRNAPHIVDRYRFIPQGGNWENIPSELMQTYADARRCHTGIYRRLRMDQPSVVLGNFRKNMLVHPTQDRGLSVREAARLQSFPDTYKFSGSIGQQQQQVGNAVPPLMAERVFKTLIEQLG